jgi:hypothetical protein
MEAIERRLAQLETKILGSHNPGCKSSSSSTAVVPALNQLARQCGNAVERRGERIAPLLRRTAELERYLDPSFGEAAAAAGGLLLAPSVKLELVLAREEKLREVDALLARVERGRAAINGEGFQRVPELEPRLLELARLHLEQEGEGRELTAETLQLMEQYNDILETLTKTFLRYDVTTTELTVTAPS